MGKSSSTAKPPAKKKAAKKAPAKTVGRDEFNKVKSQLGDALGQVARLEQMALEHLGIDLAAYDAAQEAAREAFVAANEDDEEGEPA